MATQAGNPDMFGNTFAGQYYGVLKASSENVHKFYHDESIIGRPDCDGTVRSITTTRAIKEYYLSTDLKGSSVQIDNIISQTTHEGGFHILVVGSFIMPDTVKRGFSQSFLLAPQENGGYFVISDILQYFPALPATLPLKESMDLEIPFSDLYISVSSDVINP